MNISNMRTEIQTLKRQVENMKLFPIDVVEFFAKEPNLKKSQLSMIKWKALGPIDLVDYYKENNSGIDYMKYEFKDIK